MSQDTFQKTRAAFYGSRILDTPFWAIFLMLPYIIMREFHGTPLQISLMITLKPLSSILAMYWNSLTGGRPSRLVSNIVCGGILRHLPFFFFPFIENSWLIVAAWGFHMVLARGVQPAWIEIFRINIPGTLREKVYAYGSALGHIGDIIFPCIIGYLLDAYPQFWKWIFPLTAAISLIPVCLQMRICMPVDSDYKKPIQLKPIKSHIVEPWKDAWELLRNRADFARFQIAFMFAGTALMVIQPASVVYIAKELNLSYQDLSIAILAFKGIGFALTSPMWANLIKKIDIYKFTSCVALLICIFPLLLMLSQFNIAWLYLSYLGYGVMQAGSSLCWGMSGPIFAGNQDSSLFTNVNVVAVGLRGCIAPAIGALICAYYGPGSVFFLGIVLSLIATERLMSYSRLQDVKVSS